MREILLVGSVNLADAEDVFRTVAGVLGDAVFAVPDGETGYARLAYKQCQLPFFLAHMAVGHKEARFMFPLALLFKLTW